MDHAAAFQAERRHLLAVAYRMLGTWGDAEDVVQDSFLRFREVDLATIGSLRSYLTTIVVRLCLDVLKSARVQREQYDGLWLPEPIATDDATPDRDSLAMAFLILLETLSPEERAVYVLHELFEHSHGEIAAILHKTEDASRQMLRRAHQRVAARQPRYPLSERERVDLVARFMAACTSGDPAAVRALVTDDAIAYADGAGRPGTARKPVVGADAITRYLIGITKKGGAGASGELVELNGAPGLLLRDRTGALDTVLVLELAADQRIAGLYFVRNPDKLRFVR
jgi:RNA polymerase sigma-70 factor, ECF subfamily